MYEDLVEHIKKLLDKQEVVVVAISGHGGSGKSTLADQLAKQFGVGDNQIVRMDEMYVKGYMHADGIYNQHEWLTLTQLLRQARNSDRMQFQTRSWKGTENVVDVPRPRVLIVEGVRLIRPELLSYFDISVWIDTALVIATKRALERNRRQGDSEEEIALWETKWVLEAQQYYEDAQPQKIASFIYSDSKHR